AIAYYLFITTLVAYFIILLTLLITLTFIKIKLEPVKGVCTSNARLDGKVALVTGGNQGIGLETARGLASHGATVVIACRDKDKSAQAIADIIATTGNKNIEFRHLDLASFSNVRQFAEDFNKAYDRLDILVNNAGCGGYSFSLTKDGVSEVMQINYFGPFLLTNLLLDKLKASKPSRIIIVSSCHLKAEENCIQTKYDSEEMEYSINSSYTLKVNYVICSGRRHWRKDSLKA
ncbi:SDR family NAD(P)-dependent oxidoreductase, partial [Macrococcus caseolyticus]